MGSPDSSTSEKWDLRLWATIAILCGALFFDAMDLSSVNVALPTIGSHLDMSASTLQGVVSGYVLGYGGFLLLGGRAADLLGRRRVFLVALAVFAFASALGGLFNTSLQIGAAVMVAVVSAVISSHTADVAGGGAAQGILDAMRPTLAILIAVALAGVVALFALLRRPAVQASANVVRAEA